MRLPRIISIVALVAAAAACSGGGDDDGDAASSTATGEAATVSDDATVPTTAPPTTAPPTTVPPTAPSSTVPPTTVPPTTAPPTTVLPSVPPTTASADPQAQLAATALITLGDFADGWESGPRSPDDDEQDAANVARISECAGVDPALIGEQVMGTTKAESPEFRTVDGAFTLEHTVGFAADEDTAIAAIGQIGDPDLSRCYAASVSAFFEQALADPDPADSLPPGLEISDVAGTVGDLTPFGLTSTGHWYHVSYLLTLDGESFEQHADIVFLQRGAALTQLFMTGFGASFPETDVEGIVQLADTNLVAIS